MDTINTLAGLVSEVGFPVIISIFLLVRLEKKMESLESSIDLLTTNIGSMIRIIELKNNS